MTPEREGSPEPYYPIGITVETAMSRGVIYKFDPVESMSGISTPEGIAISINDWIRIKDRIAEASLREQRKRRKDRINTPFDLQEL